MSEIISELRLLGLDNYESKALSVIIKERVSLRELSRKAGIPFGKVYSVVKSLKKKNLANETNSRPKLVYVENASEVIGKLLKEKQGKEKMFNEKLRQLATEIDKNRGKESRFFEVGISGEERRRMQLRMFNGAEEEILQVLNVHHNPRINRQSKLEYERAHERAVLRGVKTRAIYPDDSVLPVILERLAKKYPDNFQVKRIDTDFPRIDIVDSKKVLVKLAHKDTAIPGGSIFVESERLAENLKKIFNEMWEEAG